MKRLVVVAACLWPAVAHGQQVYTNADLVKFQVPGAYTNEDLRALPRLPPARVPVALPPPVEAPRVEAGELQSEFEGLLRARRALAAELAWELQRIEDSESAFAGAADRVGPRPGYRARVASLVEELKKRIALLDAEIEAALDEARRAGVALEAGGRSW